MMGLKISHNNNGWYLTFLVMQGLGPAVTTVIVASIGFVACGRHAAEQLPCCLE